MAEVLEFLKANGVEALAAWGAFLTIVSLIVKFTPSKKDDAVFDFVMKVLNALALNPNKDKIKEEVKKELDERDNDSTRSNLTSALR